jgi:hypothetical protein
MLFRGLALLILGNSLFSAALGQTNWRPTESLPLGPSAARIEISSTQRIRVTVNSGPTKTLVGADMNPDSVKTWAQSVHSELDAPKRLSYEFENTIQMQPAAKGTDSAGYIVTIADSLGETLPAFASLTQTEVLLGALIRAANRIPLLSESELTQAGPLPEDPALIACDRVRDSILTRVPSERWPNARSAIRPSHYPRVPSDVPAGVPVSASLVVLPDGSLDLTSFKVTGTTDVGYKRTALEFISKQQWAPATVSGCPVISRAGFITTYLGITRTKWP